MRFSAFIIISFCLAILPSRAQDPGAQQDEEAAREKLLKAADQLDNIQANSESTKASVEGMKADVVKLQADVTSLQGDNIILKQQVADLQAALDKAEAQRVKEREILLDEVAKMVAAGKTSSTKPSAKKKETPVATSETTPSVQAKSEVDNQGAASSLTPPPDTPTTRPASTATDGTGDAGTATPPPAPKPQKGYYHIVESGETLTMICAAYRDNGINVTVGQIKRANGLTDGTMLKVGQKLFIPKPEN